MLLIYLQMNHIDNQTVCVALQQVTLLSAVYIYFFLLYKIVNVYVVYLYSFNGPPYFAEYDTNMQLNISNLLQS